MLTTCIKARWIRSLKMAQQQGKRVAGGVNLKVNKEWMEEKAAEQVGRYGATRNREQAAEFEELCLVVYVKGVFCLVV